MSNSRSFQPTDQAQRRKQPWNKGLALTSTPSLGTVRRWLNASVDEGTIERNGTERTGKPGRPAVLYDLTEEGRRGAPTPETCMGQTRRYMEQIRRHENARKRRRMQRDTQKLKVQRKAAAKAGRKVTATANALKQAEARLLAAEITVSAIKALMEADGETSALLPEEIATLTEVGVLTEKDGRLLLAEGYTEAFDRICVEEPPDERRRAQPGPSVNPRQETA